MDGRVGKPGTRGVSSGSSGGEGNIVLQRFPQVSLQHFSFWGHSLSSVHSSVLVSWSHTWSVSALGQKPGLGVVGVVDSPDNT